MASRFDVLCVGGGVIGLSLACELAHRGVKTAVVDGKEVGKEASWAGSGIISAPGESPSASPIEELRNQSWRLFERLADYLPATTGIDIGYRRCGAIEFALDSEDATALEERRATWDQEGVDYQRLSREEIRDRLPAAAAEFRDAYWFPRACQVRNPRFLQALKAACQLQGVHLQENDGVAGFVLDRNVVSGVRLSSGLVMPADRVVVTAGAWSANLLRIVGIEIPVFPVRGQIIVFELEQPLFEPILEVGRRYLVPRADGLVLVGSTEELVGFAKETTKEGLDELKAFACRLVPGLAARPVVDRWSGLRPGTSLSHPIIGPMPEFEGLWVATGHFRQGLQLAPGTARLVADALLGQPTFTSLSYFSPTARSQAKGASFVS